jgi:hypothetical protein
MAGTGLELCLLIYFGISSFEALWSVAAVLGTTYSLPLYFFYIYESVASRFL